MIEVELPNGVIAEFPDGMKPQDIEAALQRSFPSGREMSTVTAQPVATPQEKIQASKNMIGEAVPYALDAVMAAAAPQLGIAKAAPTVLRIGGKLVNLGSRALAGGVGGMWGEAERQQMTGENAPESIAMSGAVGAGSELAAPVIGALAKPAAKVMSQATIAGRWMSDKIKKQALERVENFIAKQAPEMDPKDAVHLAGEAFAGMKKPAQELYEKYKTNLKAAADENGRIALDDTMQFLGDLREQIAKSYETEAGKAPNRLDLNNKAIVKLGIKGSENIKIFRELLETGTVDAEDVPTILGAIWENTKGGGSRFEKMAASTRREKENFKNAIVGDLDKVVVDQATNETVGGMVRNADKIYGEASNFFRENKVARELIAKYRKNPTAGAFYQADPETALKTIWNSSPLEIQNFKNELMKIDGGEKAWAAMEFDYVRDIFNSAIKEAGDLGDKRLMPFPLVEAVKKAEPKLNIVDQGLKKRIDAEIDHLVKIMGGFKEIAGTAGGALPLALHGGNLGRLAMSGDVSGVSPMVLEGLGLASAFYVLKPEYQNALGSIGKQVLKVGGHEAVKP